MGYNIHSLGAFYKQRVKRRRISLAESVEEERHQQDQEDEESPGEEPSQEQDLLDHNSAEAPPETVVDETEENVDGPVVEEEDNTDDYDDEEEDVSINLFLEEQGLGGIFQDLLVPLSQLDVPSPTTTNTTIAEEQHRLGPVPLDDIDLQFSTQEMGTYEIMRLIDNSGAPRGLYDRLMGLIKKQVKKGFDVQKATSRDLFLRRMQEKFRCPTLTSTVVSDCSVFMFPFQEMLQDLLDSRQDDEIHLFDPTVDKDADSGCELWNTPWMHHTIASYPDFDPEKEVLLPIILYMDKTGTDAYQRYSLEPVLFSLATLSREVREDRRSWRHLGFVPSTDHMEEKGSNLQFYHNCLGFILSGLRAAQTHPPLVRLTKNGVTKEMKVRLPIMLVLGDQLSQDTLCGRCKANSGGAGRVHRACMCSYLTVDDHLHNCVTVDQSLMKFMNDKALLSQQDFLHAIDREASIVNKDKAKETSSLEMKYLRRHQQMYSKILNRPYTSHSINNAFDGIDFGAWQSGIYEATFDDFMHSAESGLMAYIGTAIFGGLQPKEKEVVEGQIRAVLIGPRSSLRKDYPRWRLQQGFSRQTLMTCSERVGNIMLLALSLHIPEISSNFEAAHRRQKRKYFDFPSPLIPPMPELPNKKKRRKNTTKEATEQMEVNGDLQKGNENDFPFYYENHFHIMNETKIMHTLETLARHGYDLQYLHTLDSLQINQLVSQCAPMFGRISYPKSYPKTSINGYYHDLGLNYVVPDAIADLVRKGARVHRDKVILPKSRLIGVKKVAKKHLRDKPKVDGLGPTSAVMSDMPSLLLYLEYVLVFHSFCKYSHSLPPELRNATDLIDSSGRNLILYFNQMIYRGDNSLDSRTTKIHAQKRTGLNYLAICCLMHASCELGERLLKTEAKGISSTAQQRGNETFERQTCCRIEDKLVMDKFGELMQKIMRKREADASTYQEPQVEDEEVVPADQFGRELPHFRLSRQANQLRACDRKGMERLPDKSSGDIDIAITGQLLELESHIDEFSIYTEVIIRNGSRVRASPNHHQSGPWYDLVNVQWGNPEMIPARALCFYPKWDDTLQKMVPHALVHSVDENIIGKKFPGGYKDSILTRHYKMHYHRRMPTILSIPVASIDSAVMGFLHKPTKKLFDHESPGVMIVRPRNEWAYIWLAWNEELSKANKNSHKTNVYVSLSDEKLLSLIRKNIKEKLEIDISLTL
jgi:hypothetical protein